MDALRLTSVNDESGRRPQDEYDGEIPNLDPALVRQLSTINPGLSGFHIALEWALIIGTAALCLRYWHPVLYLVAVAFIGTRQHALIVLAHEATHYRLTRSRELNDWLGEVLLAWPFVVLSMQAYRRTHFPHHRHLNSERDPDWQRKQTPEWVYPKTPLAMVGMLALYATGVGFAKFVWIAARLPRSPKQGDEKRSRRFALGRLAFLIGVAWALSWFQLWQPFLLFWVVPYLTWMQFTFQIRSIAEHFAIRGRSGVFAQTRTVLTHAFERWFLVPKNVNYHLEHHLYPSVPFYNLPALHRALMELPSYARSAHISHGYLGMLRECTTIVEPVAQPGE